MPVSALPPVGPVTAGAAHSTVQVPASGFAELLSEQLGPASGAPQAPVAGLRRVTLGEMVASMAHAGVLPAAGIPVAGGPVGFEAVTAVLAGRAPGS